MAGIRRIAESWFLSGTIARAARLTKVTTTGSADAPEPPIAAMPLQQQPARAAGWTLMGRTVRARPARTIVAPEPEQEAGLDAR